MPLITFKICVQSGKPFPSGIGGWYRGVVAAAAPLAPITACQVAVNGAWIDVPEVLSQQQTAAGTPYAEVLYPAADRTRVSAYGGPGHLEALVRAYNAGNPHNKSRHSLLERGVEPLRGLLRLVRLRLGRLGLLALLGVLGRRRDNDSRARCVDRDADEAARAVLARGTVHTTRRPRREARATGNAPCANPPRCPAPP